MSWEVEEKLVSATTLQQLKERIIGSYGPEGREKSIERLSYDDIDMVARQLAGFVDDCLQ
jgi:hypothetical protein